MFTLPPSGFGPGSQPAPEDGTELNYLAMPSGMRTFESRIPDIADPAAVAPLLSVLRQLAAQCEEAAAGRASALDLAALDAGTRALLAETLGEGEVSVALDGAAPARIQEAAFAGVWTTRETGRSRIETAAAPAALWTLAHAPVQPARGLALPLGDGVMSAPAIVAELLEKAASRRPADMAHVVNLTLLPHTEADLAHLDAALGRGAATVLSRGYGNCRVEATAVPKVWRVRFFNSMDQLILDTIEVTDVPEVVLAAPEDLRDSAERLRETVEALS